MNQNEWLSFRDGDKIRCCEYLRIEGPNSNAKYYFKTDRPQHDLSFKFPGHRLMFYQLSSQLTISSIFHWEKYCVINREEFLLLLTYDEKKLQKSNFHDPPPTF